MKNHATLSPHNTIYNFFFQRKLIETRASSHSQTCKKLKAQRFTWGLFPPQAIRQSPHRGSCFKRHCHVTKHPQR